MTVYARVYRRLITYAAAALLMGATAAGLTAQSGAVAQPLDLPAGAIALEGVPSIQIDSTEEGTSRRTLDEREAAAHQLRVQVKDGQLYWVSRDDRPLRVDRSGEFTYLSAEPGKYIKVSRVGDRLAYVEHVELRPFGSITWWGELRVVLGP